jgi:Flp pilus assembly protein TadG
MNHIPSRSTQERERGAALIELALTLPVVLLLTLMLIQFGVLAYAGSMAEQAARQGARAGSVAQINPAGFAVAEAQRVAYTGFAIGHPHVVALAPGGVVGSELTLRVTYQVPNFVGRLAGLFTSLPTDAFAVKGEATFRREGW